MRRLWSKLIAPVCGHLQTIVVTSVGVQRVVCESCGHLSFHFVSPLTDDRKKFEVRLEKASAV